MEHFSYNPHAKKKTKLISHKQEKITQFRNLGEFAYHFPETLAMQIK